MKHPQKAALKGNRLYKCEKLCSLTAIESLFSPEARKQHSGRSVMAYPWRAVWRRPEDDGRHFNKFLISVPKKRLRHAVDRVRMRRLMREAYRLTDRQADGRLGVDIAFVYVADKLTSFDDACRSVRRIMDRIRQCCDAC